MLDMIVRLDPFFYEYIQVKRRVRAEVVILQKEMFFFAKKSAFLFDKERSAGKEKESENGEKKERKKEKNEILFAIKEKKYTSLWIE